ncbi:MAG: alpha/beta fold hydrolase [Vicinamibacterales bacterium]
MHRQYLHTGDRTIAYLDTAPAEASLPVLVLLHAFPLSAAMFEPQLKQPPAGWRVLAPDLAGFGGSSDIEETDRGAEIDDYARDVVTLLTELGVPGAVVGGVSMGGYVTFAVLRRAPELVRGVVLVDTRATADSPEGRANRRSMLAQVDREGVGAVGRDMMPKLLGATTREAGALEPTVRRIIIQQSPEAVRGAIRRMMDRPDSSRELGTLAVPLLIVVGAEDTLTPVSDAEAMAAQAPGAELAVIPAAGHLSSLEQPQAFGERLSAFLSRL